MNKYQKKWLSKPENKAKQNAFTRKYQATLRERYKKYQALREAGLSDKRTLEIFLNIDDYKLSDII